MIGYETVDLGTSSIDIPVARSKGEKGGKTLFITAGMDGDEYAGMEAAFRITQEFSEKSFRGNLIVIPIVNIPGFRAKTSENPMDGLFPKRIYPGNKKGKPTERLCWWISQFTKTADFWLDMHGGSTDERIVPYIHAWASRNRIVDALTFSIVRSISVKFAVFENNVFNQKIKLLGQDGCGYLMTESGEQGVVTKKAVDQHVVWAHQAMSILGMIDEKISESSKTIFNNVDEYVIRHDGIWYPSYSSCCQVEKGNVIGELRLATGSVVERICAKENGQLLWLKTGSQARRGDIVAGVGKG